MGGVILSIDQSNLKRVGLAMAEEANGAQLKKDLTKQLRTAMQPFQVKVKSNIMAMPTTTVHGAYRKVSLPATSAQSSVYQDSLRGAIRSQVKISVRYTGRNTGVSVYLPKNKYPRNFGGAPWDLNRGEFRHPVFGSSTWVEQAGPAGWFDSARQNAEFYRFRVLMAIDAMATRLKVRIES